MARTAQQDGTQSKSPDTKGRKILKGKLAAKNAGPASKVGKKKASPPRAAPSRPGGDFRSAQQSWRDSCG